MTPTRLLLILTLAVTSVLAGADTPTQQSNTKSKVIKSWAILDERTMESTYGRMIAKNTLGVRVSIDNPDEDNDYLVSNIAAIYGTDAPKIAQDTEKLQRAPKVGALPRDILLTLSQEGLVKNRRNVVLRIINAVGLIGGTVGTFAHVGPAYAPALVVVNGAFAQGYANLFPDLTVAQMKNVTNDAFQPNTLVSKSGGQITVTALFLLKVLMGDSDIKSYRESPHAALEKIHVVIRGTFTKETTSDSGTETN